MIKLFLLLLFTLCGVFLFAQRSDSVYKKEVFIDSLKETGRMIIDCYYSACFRHTKYHITIARNKNIYKAVIKITDDIFGNKPKANQLFKSLILKNKQVDSLRVFEKNLNIFPTEEADGQRAYYYTIKLGKKEKQYFDGILADPWMRIEGLVRILYPKFNPD